MSIIDGFSHVIISTPDVEKYTQCKDFYSLLGFQTLVNSPTLVGPECNAPQREQETWLHLFGKSPVSDITVKLVLSPDTLKRIRAEDTDWTSAEVSLAVVSQDIPVLPFKLIKCFNGIKFDRKKRVF